jgi:uncharacterized DUF497 family protein
MALLFEWDDDKARANVKKHKVSFDEARTALSDPLEMTIYDPDHSADEDRFISMGLSEQGRVLVVSYTERGDRIRIISARLANKHERKQYEEER